MSKIKKSITLLALGDEADCDSFIKFHRERRPLRSSGFDYLNLTYKELLNNNIPKIRTEKVVVFLFFPYDWWNKKIEPKKYRGIYGNKSLYKKFIHFWRLVDSSIRKNLPDKNIFFITDPSLCGKYRDKLLVKKLISRAGIPTPKTYNTNSLKDIYGYLNKGLKLYLKVRYGSMGKGITFLSSSKWMTNFTYRNKKILSRRSDTGWRFKNVTGNNSFLRNLLKKDVYIEEAIDFLPLGRKKFDLRIYTFFDKVLYVYPRSNYSEKIITNITQGGRGEGQNFLKLIPKHLIVSAKNVALKTTKILGLNFAGVDIILDGNLRDVYVTDVNLFPGFPKKRRFNLARHLIIELNKKRKLSF